MLEAYSENVTVVSDASIPFNSVTIEKGCTAVLNAPASVQLNKSGVYMVSVDASAALATTIQLFKDGVAQPQAQSTGLTPSFMTLVQVPFNNCQCPCTSPVTLEVKNTGDASATFDNANIVVTKIA